MKEYRIALGLLAVITTLLFILVVQGGITSSPPEKVPGLYIPMGDPTPGRLVNTSNGKLCFPSNDTFIFVDGVGGGVKLPPKPEMSSPLCGEE